MLLAAFAAQVGERKLDGSVGLEDSQAGHAVEVLLPATPAITGSARVEQGVPRQPEQAVKISQDVREFAALNPSPLAGEGENMIQARYITTIIQRLTAQ